MDPTALKHWRKAERERLIAARLGIEPSVLDSWRRRMDGSRPERLVAGGSVGVPAWLPGSAAFLYIQWDRDEDARTFLKHPRLKQQ